LRCERLLALSGDQFVDEDPEDLDEFNEDVLRELVRKYRTDAPVGLQCWRQVQPKALVG
jgi:hypothetical protein